MTCKNLDDLDEGIVEFEIDQTWDMIEKAIAHEGLDRDGLARKIGMSPPAFREVYGGAKTAGKTQKQIRVGQLQRLFDALGWKLSLTITKE